MNLDKIRRRDLQLIAYHEAGHLIALTRLGGYGHIRIEDAPEASDVRELRLYCGRVYILAQPTAERAHILVGLAGLVAEELLDEPLADAWELVEFIENGGIAMSETDAAMAQGWGSGSNGTVNALKPSTCPQTSALSGEYDKTTVL